MSSDFDDIRPVSAPNTGPDPRISAPTAPATGVDPRTAYQTPDPPAQADVRDFDPAPDAGSDPAFTYDGMQATPAADGDAVQGHRIATPDNPTDVRDLDPAPRATTGGGNDSGRLQVMSAGGGSGGVQTNGMSGVQDPAALNRAGQASTEMAGVVQNHGHVGSDERMWGAVGALSGDLWGGQLGVELSKTMESWDRQATKLKKLCQEIGTRCTTTAGNYTRTESANEQEMNAVRSSLSDFN
ncbi:WXG100 family type VII secretion target [Streptomyces acidicola]|uniref:WXG100 family type VII secretion target n=1 Tax=Streptomyces acidicola TaxID=2596892 RepID=UPI0037906941